MSMYDWLFGRPLATEEEGGERVGPIHGVPILGLDALASAAYGPEALLTVLLPLGAAGLRYVSWLTAAIVALLVIVFLSYRQTIAAYPNGGGAYTVSKENLGRGPSLLAAAALGLDYILNVAVATAAGVGALVSAVPSLLPHTLALCLTLLTLLTLINLRGLRATGLAFLLPTWLFVACLLLMIGVGTVGALAQGPLPEPRAPAHGAELASLALLLHAFSSGCTAMTGVEAVSNGVPIFRQPAIVGARRTLTLIIAILIALLVGEAFLCRSYGIIATPPGAPGFRSVLSQLASVTFGSGPLYYLTMGSVFVVLGLSANTSFAGFPRLCRILADDDFLPEPFVHRGRRLAFSYGILALSALSALLLVLFGGITDRLIPLFAIGAFLAFTMSQVGMVAHWRKREGARARRGAFINALGACATGITALVVLVSKLHDGAWISLLLIGAMLLLFRGVRRHYSFLEFATSVPATLDSTRPRAPLAVLPLRRWDAVGLKALHFALGFSNDVVVVQVLTGDRAVDELTPKWNEIAVQPALHLGLRPPRLLVLRSAYRQLFTPLLACVRALEREQPDREIAVIVPELVERRWYHYLLHNQNASIIKALLLFRGGPRVIIVNLPWHLEDWIPERRWLRHRKLGAHRRTLPHAEVAPPRR